MIYGILLQVTIQGKQIFKFVFDVFKGSDQLVRVKLYPDVDTGRVISMPLLL